MFFVFYEKKVIFKAFMSVFKGTISVLGCKFATKTNCNKNNENK